MLDIYTVAFFGHREIDHFRESEQALEPLIESLMREHEYVEFLVGRNGEFDQMTASTVRSVRNRLDCSNCSLVLVLPYMTAEFRDNEASFLEYYDEVEVSTVADGVHFKSAMQTRNREMVDRADLVVFCVDHASGGAYQTLKYAKKNQKPYINISEKGTALGL
ncbi:MAG: hypothetical protein IIU58_00325 [Clostridia bacterium]|nr:hypothetical protein [Clostridia bacterium]